MFVEVIVAKTIVVAVAVTVAVIIVVIFMIICSCCLPYDRVVLVLLLYRHC